MSGEGPARTIGWREWVRLPELGDAAVKAKVDTGARTSSLHAFDLREDERDGRTWLRFTIHPLQRDGRVSIEAEAPLLERREITASSGQTELRPVIETPVVIDGEPFPIELTLTRRDSMGFRMLLGRHAIKGRFLVDPRHSYRGAESRQRRRAARRARARAEGGARA